MSETTDYRQEAADDARETAEHFKDEIVAFLMDSRDASDDLLNDYSGGDAYHHENHVDRAYSLQEAADLLAELNEYEETDEGLWQGLNPREAVSTQAAYTYGNAVASMWRDLISEINSDIDVQTICTMDEGPEWFDYAPLADESLNGIDDLLGAVLTCPENIGPASDLVRDGGYKWSAQVEAGYVMEFVKAAKEFMLNNRVAEIIEGW